MTSKTAAADIDGLLMPAGAPTLFGELRKRNRRRIVFDPASQVVQADGFRHAAALEGRDYLLTMIVLKVLALCPASSVTPRTIVY